MASIPKGTRDFSPEIMLKRNYISGVIRDVFERNTFQPIETPAIECLSTLTGKYGDEGDRLIFKILPRGQNLSKMIQQVRNAGDDESSSLSLVEDALRYDLTVPFARYVVMHRNEIVFPFKRYQIQPVWRADRPQKGRYREFYQCDADVIGSDSLLNEVELIQIAQEVFSILNIPVCIRMNNRKILEGIAEVIGEPDKLTDITVAIDKLDKISLEKVNEELFDKGISKDAIDKLQDFLQLKGDTVSKLNSLKNSLQTSSIGLKGIEEMEFIFHCLEKLGQNESRTEVIHAVLDLSLARGLNYYTGAIIEVTADNIPIGSVCGGGRYDDLTGIFGLKGVSGAGISFGLDRIYDVLIQSDQSFGEYNHNHKVLFVNFGEKEELVVIAHATFLRSKGIHATVYPDRKKLNKQLEYAVKNNFDYVLFAGSEEIEKKLITVKFLNSNVENQSMSLEKFAEIAENNF